MKLDHPKAARPTPRVVAAATSRLPSLSELKSIEVLTLTEPFFLGSLNTSQLEKLMVTPRHTLPSLLTVTITVLMLSACSGSGDAPTPTTPVPVSAAPPATPPTPAEPQGLLNDDQLRTEADGNAALVDEDAAAWFQSSTKVVRSLTYDQDFSDLAFVQEALGEKRLVMLGESSHGVREFSQAKLRLIKHLHQNLGFSVLAFEGGLFDCEQAQVAIERSLPVTALNRCLFQVWHTETLGDLLDYVLQTQSTANPLRLTGFDVQFSGTASSERAAHTAELVRKASSVYADDVLELESSYYLDLQQALAANSSDDPAMTRLRLRLNEFSAAYRNLAEFLTSNVTRLTADGQFSTRDVLIAAQYARTSPLFAQQVSERFTFESGGRARDQGMADNLTALVETIYPDDKIIGWAHNAHLRHQGTGFLPNGNMGTLVHNALESELYTVGFYMYRGQHAFNDRSLQTVAAPLNFSLEAVFYTRRMKYLFVDLESVDTTQTGATWLTQSTPTWSWGVQQNDLRLQEEYDGLFLIDTVTPPDFL